MTSIADLRARAKSPDGQRAIKYTLVSVISVIVTQIALLGLQFVLVAWIAAVGASMIGAVPSYWLNRRWAWGKTGKGHIWKEHVPFWTITIVGIAFSALCVAFADHWGQAHLSGDFSRKLFVNAANLGAFGILWIGKFLVFNKFMFGVDHSGIES